MYLWQARGVCLIGHGEHPLWQGNAKTAQDGGYRRGHLCTLHHRLAVQAVAHHLSLIQSMTNRPPRLLTPDLRRPFQQQGQPTELHMGDEPTRAPLGERPGL
jgi:hypothetical protein